MVIFKRNCLDCGLVFQPSGKFSKFCVDCLIKRSGERKELCRCGKLKYKSSSKCLNCYRSSNKRKHIKTPKELLK